MASIRDLGGAAELILSEFVTQLEVLGVEIPERRYVAPGSMIPWDGEQLVVNLQQIEQGHPGAPQGGTFTPTATVLMAAFTVSIVREIPALSGDHVLSAMIPDGPTLDGAGTFAMGDAAGLALAAVAVHQSYLVTSPGEDFEIGPCAAVGPEGAMAGHRLQIAVSLS